MTHRVRVPRRTVRLRLTLLYGALFLASGAALLSLTYVLVRNASGDVVHATNTHLQPRPGPKAPAPSLAPLRSSTSRLRAQASAQRAAQLHDLLVQSAIALAVMAVFSIALGWLVAGRVLRPLRTMTAATRRISERNLHERLMLEGPSDELKDLGDTIDGLLARLEAAFEAQRRFVANASHELRTPLAMMRTSLDVAIAKPGPPSPQVAALEIKLREGLDRADRLVEDFLALAQAQQVGVPDQTTVPLAGAVSRALERRADALAERSIRVQRELAAANAVGSPTLLSHMVDNLIDNAIRHNAPSGWIRVRTRTDDGAAVVCIENSGPHLDEQTVAELTQPFRRARSERTRSENGFGLGLSIVAAIVNAHGGRLELHARDGGGIEARVELPAPRSDPGPAAA